MDARRCPRGCGFQAPYEAAAPAPSLGNLTTHLVDGHGLSPTDAANLAAKAPIALGVQPDPEGTAP